MLMNLVFFLVILLYGHIFTACYCGQSQRKVPCTSENAMIVYYSCGKPCGKELPCENHLCQKPCHSGQCEPCKALNVSTCPCGKRSLTRDELYSRTSCTQAIPICNQLCERPLECGPPGMCLLIPIYNLCANALRLL